MRYFVLSGDGSKYGPADVPTLNSWITEGRLLPGTMLEEEGSGNQLVASAVSGLNFPNAQQVSGPQGSIYSNPPTAGGPGQAQSTHSASYAQNYNAPVDDGKGLIIASWILGGIGLFTWCCYIGFILIIVGAVLAYVAKNKGNEKANAPFIFNIVILVLCLFFFIGLRMAGKSLQNWGQQMQAQQQQQLRSSAPAPTTGQ